MRTKMTVDITCPVCNQKLRVPTDKGELSVRCPKCRHAWDWPTKAAHQDSDKERLADLLLQWEESFEQGLDIPVEDLCRDCPNLIPALAEGISALKQMNWVNK